MSDSRNDKVNKEAHQATTNEGPERKHDAAEPTAAQGAPAPAARAEQVSVLEQKLQLFKSYIDNAYLNNYWFKNDANQKKLILNAVTDENLKKLAEELEKFEKDDQTRRLATGLDSAAAEKNRSTKNYALEFGKQLNNLGIQLNNQEVSQVLLQIRCKRKLSERILNLVPKDFYFQGKEEVLLEHIERLSEMLKQDLAGNRVKTVISQILKELGLPEEIVEKLQPDFQINKSEQKESKTAEPAVAQGAPVSVAAETPISQQASVPLDSDVPLRPKPNPTTQNREPIIIHAEPEEKKGAAPRLDAQIKGRSPITKKQKVKSKLKEEHDAEEKQEQNKILVELKVDISKLTPEQLKRLSGNSKQHGGKKYPGDKSALQAVLKEIAEKPEAVTDDLVDRLFAENQLRRFYLKYSKISPLSVNEKKRLRSVLLEEIKKIKTPSDAEHLDVWKENLKDSVRKHKEQFEKYKELFEAFESIKVEKVFDPEKSLEIYSKEESQRDFIENKKKAADKLIQALESDFNLDILDIKELGHFVHRKNLRKIFKHLTRTQDWKRLASLFGNELILERLILGHRYEISESGNPTPVEKNIKDKEHHEFVLSIFDNTHVSTDVKSKIYKILASNENKTQEVYAELQKKLLEKSKINFSEIKQVGADTPVSVLEYSFGSVLSPEFLTPFFARQLLKSDYTQRCLSSPVIRKDVISVAEPKILIEMFRNIYIEGMLFEGIGKFKYHSLDEQRIASALDIIKILQEKQAISTIDKRMFYLLAIKHAIQSIAVKKDWKDQLPISVSELRLGLRESLAELIAAKEFENLLKNTPAIHKLIFGNENEVASYESVCAPLNEEIKKSYNNYFDQRISASFEPVYSIYLNEKIASNRHYALMRESIKYLDRKVSVVSRAELPVSVSPKINDRLAEYKQKDFIFVPPNGYDSTKHFYSKIKQKEYFHKGLPFTDFANRHEQKQLDDALRHAKMSPDEKQFLINELSTIFGQQIPEAKFGDFVDAIGMQLESFATMIPVEGYKESLKKEGIGIFDTGNKIVDFTQDDKGHINISVKFSELPMKVGAKDTFLSCPATEIRYQLAKFEGRWGVQFCEAQSANQDLLAMYRGELNVKDFARKVKEKLAQGQVRNISLADLIKNRSQEPLQVVVETGMKEFEQRWMGDITRALNKFPILVGSSDWKFLEEMTTKLFEKVKSKMKLTDLEKYFEDKLADKKPVVLSESQRKIVYEELIKFNKTIINLACKELLNSDGTVKSDIRKFFSLDERIPQITVNDLVLAYATNIHMFCESYYQAKQLEAEDQQANELEKRVYSSFVSEITFKLAGISKQDFYAKEIEDWKRSQNEARAKLAPELREILGAYSLDTTPRSWERSRINALNAAFKNSTPTSRNKMLPALRDVGLDEEQAKHVISELDRKHYHRDDFLKVWRNLSAEKRTDLSGNPMWERTLTCEFSVPNQKENSNNFISDAMRSAMGQGGKGLLYDNSSVGELFTSQEKTLLVRMKDLSSLQSGSVERNSKIFSKDEALASLAKEVGWPENKDDPSQLQKALDLLTERRRNLLKSGLRKAFPEKYLDALIDANYEEAAAIIQSHLAFAYQSDDADFILSVVSRGDADALHPQLLMMARLINKNDAVYLEVKFEGLEARFKQNLDQRRVLPCPNTKALFRLSSENGKWKIDLETVDSDNPLVFKMIKGLASKEEIHQEIMKQCVPLKPIEEVVNKQWAVSSQFNNHQLHALTKDILLNIQFLAEEKGDHPLPAPAHFELYRKNYETLREVFSEWIGLGKDKLSWKEICSLLTEKVNNNQNKAQVILGFVLREFMKKMDSHNHNQIYYGMTSTGIKIPFIPQAHQFRELLAKHVAEYVCKPLGFDLEVLSTDKPFAQEPMVEPLGKIIVYGDKWKRVDKQYQNNPAYEEKDDAAKNDVVVDNASLAAIIANTSYNPTSKALPEFLRGLIRPDEPVVVALADAAPAPERKSDQPPEKQWAVTRKFNNHQLHAPAREILQVIQFLATGEPAIRETAREKFDKIYKPNYENLRLVFAEWLGKKGLSWSELYSLLTAKIDDNKYGAQVILGLALRQFMKKNPSNSVDPELYIPKRNGEHYEFKELDDSTLREFVYEPLGFTLKSVMDSSDKIGNIAVFGKDWSRVDPQNANSTNQEKIDYNIFLGKKLGFDVLEKFYDDDALRAVGTALHDLVNRGPAEHVAAAASASQQESKAPDSKYESKYDKPTSAAAPQFKPKSRSSKKVILHYFSGDASWKNKNPFGHVAIQLIGYKDPLLGPQDKYLTFGGVGGSVEGLKKIGEESGIYGGNHIQIEFDLPEDVNLSKFVTRWQEEWRGNYSIKNGRNCAHSAADCMEKLLPHLGKMLKPKPAKPGDPVYYAGIRPSEVANHYLDLKLKELNDRKQELLNQNNVDYRVLKEYLQTKIEWFLMKASKTSSKDYHDAAFQLAQLDNELPYITCGALLDYIGKLNDGNSYLKDFNKEFKNLFYKLDIEQYDKIILFNRPKRQLYLELTEKLKKLKEHPQKIVYDKLFETLQEKLNKIFLSSQNQEDVDHFRKLEELINFLNLKLFAVSFSNDVLNEKVNEIMEAIQRTNSRTQKITISEVLKIAKDKLGSEVKQEAEFKQRNVTKKIAITKEWILNEIENLYFWYNLAHPNYSEHKEHLKDLYCEVSKLARDYNETNTIPFFMNLEVHLSNVWQEFIYRKNFNVFWRSNKEFKVVEKEVIADINSQFTDHIFMRGLAHLRREVKYALSGDREIAELKDLEILYEDSIKLIFPEYEYERLKKLFKFFERALQVLLPDKDSKILTHLMETFKKVDSLTALHSLDFETAIHTLMIELRRAHAWVHKDKDHLLYKLLDVMLPNPFEPNTEAKCEKVIVGKDITEPVKVLAASDHALAKTPTFDKDNQSTLEVNPEEKQEEKQKETQNEKPKARIVDSDPEVKTESVEDLFKDMVFAEAKYNEALREVENKILENENSHIQTTTHTEEKIKPPRNVHRTMHDISKSKESKPLPPEVMAALIVPQGANLSVAKQKIGPKLAGHQVAVNIVQYAKGHGSYIEKSETKAGNDYRISVVRMPDEINFGKLVEQQLHSYGILPDKCKEVARQVNQLQKFNQDEVKQVLSKVLEQKISQAEMGQFWGKLEEKRYAPQCKTIPNATYLDFAAKQIATFVATVGTKHYININYCSDPALMQAYQLICAVNNLAYKVQPSPKADFEAPASSFSNDQLNEVKKLIDSGSVNKIIELDVEQNQRIETAEKIIKAGASEELKDAIKGVKLGIPGAWSRMQQGITQMKQATTQQPSSAQQPATPRASRSNSNDNTN